MARQQISKGPRVFYTPGTDCGRCCHLVTFAGRAAVLLLLPICALNSFTSPFAGPRAWSSCHNLSTSHPCKLQAKPHRKRGTRGKASIPPNRTISLSHLPQSHLPVASHQQQLPLLSSSNQPLSLELFQATPPVPPVPVPTLAPGPSQLPCPQHPAKPQRDPPAASQAFLQAQLEQKVALVLEGHPEGMSLFHFRQAYSATYLTSFPLDGATSVKDKLQAMPRVVRVQGCGAQTLVFSATSQRPATSPKWLFITGEDEGHIGKDPPRDWTWDSWG